MAADAAIAIGLVLMVPDPCTSVVCGTVVVGHPPRHPLLESALF
jgi:hypothetical protein